MYDGDICNVRVIWPSRLAVRLGLGINRRRCPGWRRRRRQCVIGPRRRHWRHHFRKEEDVGKLVKRDQSSNCYGFNLEGGLDIRFASAGVAVRMPQTTCSLNDSPPLAVLCACPRSHAHQVLRLRWRRCTHAPKHMLIKRLASATLKGCHPPRRKNRTQTCLFTVIRTCLLFMCESIFFNICIASPGA